MNVLHLSLRYFKDHIKAFPVDLLLCPIDEGSESYIVSQYIGADSIHRHRSNQSIASVVLSSSLLQLFEYFFLLLVYISSEVKLFALLTVRSTTIFLGILNFKIKWVDIYRASKVVGVIDPVRDQFVRFLCPLFATSHLLGAPVHIANLLLLVKVCSELNPIR